MWLVGFYFHKQFFHLRRFDPQGWKSFTLSSPFSCTQLQMWAQMLFSLGSSFWQRSVTHIPTTRSLTSEEINWVQDPTFHSKWRSVFFYRSFVLLKSGVQRKPLPDRRNCSFLFCMNHLINRFSPFVSGPQVPPKHDHMCPCDHHMTTMITWDHHMTTVSPSGGRSVTVSICTNQLTNKNKM